MALAFILITPAFAEDAQPDRAGEEPQASHHSGGSRTMVRYPKPVMHNGHLVLWHGVWHGGRAHPRPGQTVAQPEQPAAPAPAQEAAPAAKPTAPRQMTILADSGDPTALRLAGELVGVMNGDDAQFKTFTGATSRAVMAKAVASDAADFALVPLDQFVEPGQGADWRQRAPYIARLHNEEIELVTPRAIADIRQLAGRKVNVGAADSAAAASAALIFSRFNVAATWTNFTLREALQRLKDGRIDAVLTIGGRNSELLTAFGDDGRFHFAAIPYSPALGAAYAPARASAKDWPKLIGADDKVDTLSVPLALIAVDGGDPERAQRLAPAAGRFLANFEQLQDESKDPGWREVNLAAQLDQTPRFIAAQTWLDQNKGAGNADLDAFRATAQAVDANGGPNGADSDRLYQNLIRLSGAGQ